MKPRCPRALALALAATGTLALAASPAMADVAGPDDSLSAAYGPFAAGTPVQGAFSASDTVDYLAFQVTQPNQSLHFTVQNTTANCNSVSELPCPVWGTLLDSGGQQLGGEGSSAGTAEVDQGASDVIDWSFPTAGTYYLAMDSAGDNSTYSVGYDAIAPAGGGTGKGKGKGNGGANGGSGTSTTPPAGAAVFRSVLVRSPHRGPVLRVRISLGQHLRRLSGRLLLGGGGATVAHTTRANVGPGHVTLTLRLSKAARRTLSATHRLPVRLVLSATTESGTVVGLSRSALILP